MLVRHGDLCESRVGGRHAVREAGGRANEGSKRAPRPGHRDHPAMLGALLPQLASAAPEKGSGRYLVRARSAADYAGLRAKAVQAGARVAARPAAAQDDGGQRAGGRAEQPGRRPAGPRGGQATGCGGSPSRTRPPRPTCPRPARSAATRVDGQAAGGQPAAAGINPDPAWDYKGLLWDYRRIGLPQGWNTTAGSAAVTVGGGRHRPRLHPPRAGPQGQAGRRLHHASRTRRSARRCSASPTRSWPPSSAARSTTDWNGHGSWIGGNIAAALNGTGINGIAPKVDLVSLKISQWCGLGLRLEHPDRVHDRRRHGPRRRQHLLRRLHRPLRP